MPILINLVRENIPIWVQWHHRWAVNVTNNCRALTPLTWDWLHLDSPVSISHFIVIYSLRTEVWSTWSSVLWIWVFLGFVCLNQLWFEWINYIIFFYTSFKYLCHHEADFNPIMVYVFDDIWKEQFCSMCQIMWSWSLVFWIYIY